MIARLPSLNNSLTSKYISQKIRDFPQPQIQFLELKAQLIRSSHNLDLMFS